MIERDKKYLMDYEDSGFSDTGSFDRPPTLLEQRTAASQTPEGIAKLEADDKQKAVMMSLAQQIMGQNLTDKWSGQGWGSAEANARDMAKILAGIGITDISQFGKITRPVESYVGTDDSGNPIYETRNEETFGNKLTGQVVPTTYSERQTGNFFGGTFEGKGNTGYGVQFDSQGNPLFYTQGASSSDLGNIAPLLTMASFVPGLAPFAQGLNALIAAKQGNILGAVAGAAGLGGMTDVANAAKFANALKSGDPLAIAMAGANAGGISDVGGIDLKDISKTIGAVKAIESGDPLAMLRYGMSAFPQSGGATSTPGAQKDFFDSEQARLTAAGYSKDDIKNYFSNLENLTEDLDFEPKAPPVDNTPPMPTRSLSGDTQREEADDFLKSIGIYTLDKPSDSGLSNQDILDMINADNGMLITANREPKYLPTDDDFMPTPIRNEGELTIVDKRPVSYLPTDDDFPSTPMPTTPGTTGSPSPTPSAGAPKMPTAAKPTTPTASSGMNMSGLMALLGGQQQPAQQAPMQDPYAHIKLMEDLFGSEIDLTPTGNRTA
jgi:hypothetical protein